MSDGEHQGTKHFKTWFHYDIYKASLNKSDHHISTVLIQTPVVKFIYIIMFRNVRCIRVLTQTSPLKRNNASRIVMVSDRIGNPVENGPGSPYSII